MMRISIFFFAILAVFQLKSQEIITNSIIHDGITREYHVYIPDTYVSGNPLLMNFHGSGNTGLAQMFYGNFMEIADTSGFLILSPEGTLDTEGYTHWNVGFPSDSDTDDLGFVNALLDAVHLEFDYDLQRVYSTGMSNGGFLSYLLACEMSDRIAAIASVTGSMTIGLTDDCNCQHPMPVMQIHGTSDPVVPYNGGGLYTSIDDVIDYWITYNSIPDVPEIYQFPNLDITDGSTAERWLYQNEVTGIDLSLIKIIGGGHTWPGATAPTEDTNYDIDASLEIWKFLSKYDRGEGPSSELILNLHTFLEGPYQESTGTMNDNLRLSGLIPLSEPFSNLGYDLPPSSTSIEVFEQTGNDAIVDWVLIELRSGNDPTVALEKQAALLKRDGEIVSVDGISPLHIAFGEETNVYVAIRHRNHLGIRTANSYSTASPITIDFSSPITNLFGTDPVKQVGDKNVMISGDANSDGFVNSIDKNSFWRIQNGEVYEYTFSRADFNLDGIVNSVDRNMLWRINNASQEQLD